MTYRGFDIIGIWPPIPTKSYDYAFGPSCDDEPNDDGIFAHQYLHGFGESEESCKKQIDTLLADLDECKSCCGLGWIAWSCCGQDITLNDFDNCPECGEHCVTDEGDECEECYGTGRIIDQQKNTE